MAHCFQHRQSDPVRSEHPANSAAPQSWWSQAGSNRRPRDCQSRALPSELWPHKGRERILAFQTVGFKGCSAGLFHASRMVLILGWRQRGLAFRCRFVYKGAWQMDSTRLSWSWARWKCGWRARTSADDGTISWRGTTTWGFGSSRAAGCVTSRCGAGTGWRCWAGNRERSSAHRGIAGWAGTGRCSSGACT